MKRLLSLLLLLTPALTFGQTNYGRIQTDRIANKQTITVTGATPNVSQGNVFKTNNVSPTTITNFTGGVDSQTITLVCGDVNTTVQNGTSIITASGANISCSLNQSQTFTYDAGQTKWVQTASGATPPAGASGDLQQKGAGGGFAASPLNNNGSKVTSSLPVQVPIITNASITTITGATPSVSGNNVFRTNNGGATTVTNFTGGVDSQQIQVICGDTNTTIQNNSNIVTASGSDITCTSNLTQQFVFISATSKWVQSGNPGGNANPLGNNGDLQSKNGAALAASGVNDDGTKLTISRDVHPKGPNPYVDVTAYGVRAVTSTPSTTGSISATSTTLTLAAASTFQNGDGIVVRGAGATNTLSTPSAPTVSPSNAQAGTGTGLVVANTSGATTYQYQIVARNTGGGYTVASTATSIANGPATLGSQNVNISSWSASNNTVTVNTSTNHNLVVGSMFLIQGAGNANGWYRAATVPNNTQFTFTTTDDTRLGADASGGAAGTVTWFNCNHITWTAVTGAYEYFIYGRTSGSMALIGISFPQTATFSVTLTGDSLDKSFDDFGSTMTPNISSSNVPDWVPLTPPVSAKNNDLVTTIVSGAGTTTLTVNDAATNTVASATTKFDNAPNIRTAAVAASSAHNVLYFPAGAGFFVTNSFLDLGLFPNTLAVMQAGDISANDTIKFGIMQWSGQPINPSAQSSFQLWKLPQIITATAFPLIYTPSSLNKIDHISLIHNSPSGVIYVNDQGGGLPGIELDHMNFTTSGNDYMAMHFVLRSDQLGGGNHLFRSIGLSSGLSNVLGLSATPLWFIEGGGPMKFENFSMARRGLLFVPAPSGSTVIANSFYIQGGITPLFSVFGTGGTPTFNFDLHHVTLDTTSAPVFSWYGSPQGLIHIPGLTSGNSQPNFSGPSGTQMVVQVTDSVGGSGGATASANAITTPNIGFAQDGLLNTSRGSYSANIYNTGILLGNYYQATAQAAVQAAPTCSVSAGGSVAINSYTFKIAPVFPGLGLGAVSPASTTCTTSSGQQTVTVNWATVPGAIGYSLYANGFAFATSGAWVTPGSNTQYIWSSGTTGASQTSTIVGSGPVGFNVNGLWSPSLKVVSTDLGGTSTITAPVLSANRTHNLPNANGTFLLDSTIGTTTLSAYDTFNRANGNCGTNWTGVNASANCTITSNAAATSNVATQIYFYNAGNFNADQFSEVRLSNVTATVEGAAVRASQTNNEYACRETTTTLDMGKIVAGGGFVSLGSTGITGVSGDIIRLEVSGSSLSCFRNGVLALGPTTDTSLTTGQPGFWTGGTGATIDNWSGGNLHPVAKLDVENDWVQPQHFTQPVTLGVSDTAPIAGALTKSIYDTTQTASTPLCTDANKAFVSGSGCNGIVVTPSSTDTLTNKTLDAEGTGNTITIPVKPFINAALCNNATAGPALNLPAASAPTVNCRTGTNVNEGTLDFADGDSAQFNYFLPSDWTGAIDARALFFSPDTSGTVIWQIATACTGVGGSATDDTAFNTANAFGTITLGATANGQWAATVTGITTTGCSAGNGIAFKVSRTTDTATSRARLKGVELTIRRAM